MINPKTLQKGQPVAIVLTVDDIIPGLGNTYVELGRQEPHSREFKVSICYGNDEMGEIYATSDFIIPAPREGEYRLTLKEIEWLVCDYQDKKQSVRGVESIADFVKQWLENRKEEA